MRGVWSHRRGIPGGWHDAHVRATSLRDASNVCVSDAASFSCRDCSCGAVQKGARDYILNRFNVLVYPAILWSIIHAGARQAASKYVNWGPAFLETLETVTIHPFGELWFLYVLFFISVFVLILYKLRSPPPGILLGESPRMFSRRTWRMTRRA